MSDELKIAAIRVYVGVVTPLYTCQWRDEAGGFTCGKCGLGALGTSPQSGDKCKECGAIVYEVRHG